MACVELALPVGKHPKREVWISWNVKKSMLIYITDFFLVDDDDDDDDDDYVDSDFGWLETSSKKNVCSTLASQFTGMVCEDSQPGKLQRLVPCSRCCC